MENKKNKGYHKLLIWQKAYYLVLEVYKVTKTYPKTEEYILTSQLRRASISVVLNIVEGNRRGSKKDFLHFLNISASSLTELEAAFEISFGLSYISEADYRRLDTLISELGYLLGAFIKSLNKPSTLPQKSYPQ